MTPPPSIAEGARPLCIDIFCGLGGWTEGFLAEGYDVIGFDVEQHVYGEHRYPAQLVLQDVCTLHGSQFRDATCIVASSPCQEFSYRAMPWKRAKALGPPELGMHLFAQAARIQREACEAAGRYIPMVQENVCGAQKWVGRARWHYGSYYLWGDVPALMPVAHRAVKVTTMGAGWYPPSDPRHVRGLGFNTHADRATRALGDGVKVGDRNKARDAGGHQWTAQWSDDGRTRPPCEYAHTLRTRRCGKQSVGEVEGLSGRVIPTCARHAELMVKLRASRDACPDESLGDGIKQGGEWFGDSTPGALRSHSSKSTARKAASARIAKIPFALASHIARVFASRPSMPEERREPSENSHVSGPSRERTTP